MRRLPVDSPGRVPGRTFAVILPRANTERMSDALAAFAAEVDPGGRKGLVVLVDNAGWHRARRLAVSPNVVLDCLPPCPPELQPAEPLWPLVRDRLRAILRCRLAYLAGHGGRAAGGRVPPGLPDWNSQD